MSAPESRQIALNRKKRLQSHLENGPEEPELKAGCLLEQYRAGSMVGFELFRPCLAISQSVLLADAACDDETVFRDGLRALGLLCPVSIRSATTVGAPVTAPLPPKPRIGRGARPTKLRRKPGNEPVSVKGQRSKVKGQRSKVKGQG